MIRSGIAARKETFMHKTGIEVLTLKKYYLQFLLFLISQGKFAQRIFRRYTLHKRPEEASKPHFFGIIKEL
jgi:hypothetical protein